MNYFLKILLLAWVCFIGYYMLPLKKPIHFHPYIENTSILATQQFCESECADVIIKKGMVLLPDSLQRIFPNIRTDVANLSGNSPFRHKNSTLMFSYDFILSGKITGIDSTNLEGYIPIYTVEEWYPTQYIARFWQLEGFMEVFYLTMLNLGLPLVLYFILKIKEKGVKNII
jgi:hypothetical protein